MKKLGLCVVALFSTSVLAAADEAALKEQMHKACAPLFAAGGACADLAKGTRKCTRQNADKGGASCVDFEKAHKAFFDAGMNDPTIRK
ncbi:MAG: hypothetical protein WBP72_04510 [Rhodocyclaceae bacterium]